MCVLKRNRSFFLWPGFNNFFDIFGGVTSIFGKKTWNICGFMKVDKKVSWNLEGFWWFHEMRKWNKLKPPGTKSGPVKICRGSSSATTKNPPGFNLFFYRLSWNHKWFQVFLTKIFVKPPKISKILMKPGHKKKMRGFYLKLNFRDSILFAVEIPILLFFSALKKFCLILNLLPNFNFYRGWNRSKK